MKEEIDHAEYHPRLFCFVLIRNIILYCKFPYLFVKILASGRANCRKVYKAGAARAEHARVERLIDKRQRRKQRAGLDLPHPPP